jgi:transcriptional regulator with XRE-family HTH domain
MGRKPLEIDDSTLRGKIAVRLRKARQKKFPTQQQFADALVATGVQTTKSSVSYWESGRHMPDIETLYTIAELCNTTVQKLLP